MPRGKATAGAAEQSLLIPRPPVHISDSIIIGPLGVTKVLQVLLIFRWHGRYRDWLHIGRNDIWHRNTDQTPETKHGMFDTLVVVHETTGADYRLLLILL